MRSLFRRYFPWIVAALVSCASVMSWSAIVESTQRINAAAQSIITEAESLKSRSQSQMSFQTLKVKNGPGEDATVIASYEDVTDYTEHSNYVSFKHGPNHTYVTVPTGDVWIVTT